MKRIVEIQSREQAKLTMEIRKFKQNKKKKAGKQMALSSYKI